MTRTRATIVIIAVLAMLVVLVVARPRGCFTGTGGAGGGTAQPSQPSVPAGYVASALIAVVASSSGANEEKTWWLSVNSAGQAEVTLSSRDPLRFQVPQDDWDAFRKALEQERFFDLDPAYGGVVPDGSTQTLTVAAGGVTRTVTVHYLMNLPAAERQEADPAARLVATVRGWVDAAAAAGRGSPSTSRGQ